MPDYNGVDEKGLFIGAVAKEKYAFGGWSYAETIHLRVQWERLDRGLADLGRISAKSFESLQHFGKMRG